MTESTFLFNTICCSANSVLQQRQARFGKRYAYFEEQHLSPS